VSRSRNRVVGRISGYVGTYGALTLLVAVVCFPVYWMILTSLRARPDIFASPPQLLPTNLTFENYRTVLDRPEVSRYLFNSVKVSLLSAGGGVVIASLAAYAFSRFRFRGRTLLLSTVLFTQLFPAVVLILPLFILWDRIGLLDSHIALVVSYLAFTVPIGAWLLRSFFDAVPIELEEAALVDGSTRLGAMIKITLPLSAPGIASVFLYLFIAVWNEFLMAFTFINNDDLRTLSVGVFTFQGQYSTNWGAIMAVSTIAALPILVLFVVLQRYFVQGLGAGALKG
jgi:ABC-type glycerol-3-phosphate transport system permease component